MSVYRGQYVSLVSGAKRKIIAHEHCESFQHLRRASQQRTMLALCFFSFAANSNCTAW